MASDPTNIRASAILSWLLLVVTVVISLMGLLRESTYARETFNWRTQGEGQDYVDLFLLSPALLLCVFLSGRGKRLATFFHGGILLFFVYTYVIYAFAVHFNQLFLFYCAGLGLSVYALVAWFSENASVAPGWFDTKRSTKFPSIFLLVNGLLFYLLWLKEDLPAVWNGTVPADLSAGQFFTNPVHVLDLSLLLPAFLYAGHQLYRKRPAGYLLAPTILCFSISMAANVGFLAWYMAFKRVTPPNPVPFIFGGLILVTAGVLAYVIRGLKKR
jgi:hypothetical protein